MSAAAETRAEVRWVQRWSKHQIAQHLLMVTSFTVLSVTGLALRGAHGSLGAGIIRVVGGPDTAGIIHRIAAGVLIFDVAYHLVWLVVRWLLGYRGYAMVPGKKDFRDLWEILLYFFTFRKEPPKFERYSFSEKFDYYAAGFGCVVMIGSGLVLWFPSFVLSVFPVRMARELFAVAEVIHSDEAILAVLAIVIWHFYHSHLKPGMFPLSRVFLTGRMTEAQMRRYHTAEWERMERPAGRGKATGASAGDAQHSDT